jgi:hypothetical protein
VFVYEEEQEVEQEEEQEAAAEEEPSPRAEEVPSPRRIYGSSNNNNNWNYWKPRTAGGGNEQFKSVGVL